MPRPWDVSIYDVDLVACVLWMNSIVCMTGWVEVVGAGLH